MKCDHVDYCPHCNWKIESRDRRISELEQRLAAAESKIPKWISVNERLPQHDGIVYVACLGGFAKVTYFKQDADYFRRNNTWQSPATDSSIFFLISKQRQPGESSEAAEAARQPQQSEDADAAFAD